MTGLCKRAGCGRRPAMLASLGTRAVTEHRAVSAVFERLAFENAPVFQIQMKHVASHAIRHRVELHHHRLPGRGHIQCVTDAAQAAMTTMQTANAPKRLVLRHIAHPERRRVQTPRLVSIRWRSFAR